MRLGWLGRFCALVLLGALLAAPAAQAQSAPTDPAEFTALVAARFQAVAPALGVKVTGPLALETQGAGGGSMIYLNTLYDHCLRAPQLDGQLIADFVSKMAAFAGTPDTPTQRTALRVVVRPSAYVEKLAAAGHGGPVAVALCGDLWVIGAQDTPTAIAMLNDDSLAPTGLSPAAALARGRANMRGEMQALLRQAQQQLQSGPNLLTGDPYEASLLAFPDLWAPLAQGFGGNLLVAVPASDVVLMSDGRSSDAVANLREAAQTVVAQADRPFDTSVFRWSPNGWVALPQTGPIAP